MKSFELLLIKSLILMITVSFNMPHSSFSQEKPKEKEETVKIIITKKDGEIIIDTVYVIKPGELDAINLKEEVNKIINLEVEGQEGKELLRDIYISVAANGQMKNDTAGHKNIVVWTAVEEDGEKAAIKLIYGNEDRNIIIYDDNDTALKKIQKRTIIIHTLTVSGMEDVDKEILDKAGIVIPEKQLELEELAFFPNPNDGEFTLSFSTKEKGQFIIKVVDIQGKVVHQEIHDNFTGKYNKNIDIKENSKGTYFLIIQHGQDLSAHKIIYQ
jgi:hypothetical protein